jgi:carboxymethylenebutenolidase
VSRPTRTEKVAVDGGSFDLHVWLPPQGSGPGVLLIQEIFGVGDYIKAVAARLARDGYVVAAPDLFWRLSPGWAAHHDEAGLTASIELVGRFDLEQGVTDAVAAFGRLRGLTEVRGGAGVLGFCLGGTIAHQVGAEGAPDAVVSYYGSGVADTIGRLADIECPALYHFGGKDDYIPAEQVERVVAAVEASGRDDVRVEVQPGAGHAFDNHEAAIFHDANAAAAAWAVTETFLAEHLIRG